MPALPAGHFSGADLGDLANVAGSPAAALFLAKAVEFQGRAATKNGGWWLKTWEEWIEATGLSRPEQETARRRLKQSGILKAEKRGWPSRMWYRVDEEVLAGMLRQRKLAAIKDQIRTWH